MRKYLLAAVAVAAIASPAAARDGTGYIGLEGGLMFPSDMDIEGEFLFEDPDGVDFLESDIAELEFNTGLDLDLIGGYDFGGFRLDAELGYKRASADDVDFDDDFIEAVFDPFDQFPDGEFEDDIDV